MAARTPYTVSSLVSGRQILSNAKFLYLGVWSGTDSNTPPTTYYDLTDIVADTLSIEPDDNDINTIDSEFVDSPLKENVTLGNIKVAATCIDVQNAILKNIYGWDDVTPTGSADSAKASFAPTSYVDIYAAMIVGFSNGLVVAPRVRLDSKAVFSSLKTGSAQSQIGGTCYNAAVAFKGNTAAGTGADFGTDATYKLCPLASLPLAMTAASGGTTKSAADTAKDNVDIKLTVPTA